MKNIYELARIKRVYVSTYIYTIYITYIYINRSMEELINQGTVEDY
jgi:hypothetical protein